MVTQELGWFFCLRKRLGITTFAFTVYSLQLYLHVRVRWKNCSIIVYHRVYLIRIIVLCKVRYT